MRVYDRNKKLLLKIGILILIGLLISVIWVFKNIGSDKKVANSTEFALDATENFDIDKLLSSGLPVMIDFGSDSCIPCKEMAPTLKELNKEFEGKVIIKFVDVWKNPEAAKDFPIKVIPTQLFFDKDGNPYKPSDDINQMILYSNKETNEHVFTAHEGGLSKEEIIKILEELGA